MLAHYRMWTLGDRRVEGLALADRNRGGHIEHVLHSGLLLSSMRHNARRLCGSVQFNVQTAPRCGDREERPGGYRVASFVGTGALAFGAMAPVTVTRGLMALSESWMRAFVEVDSHSVFIDAVEQEHDCGRRKRLLLQWPFFWAGTPSQWKTGEVVVSRLMSPRQGVQN